MGKERPESVIIIVLAGGNLCAPPVLGVRASGRPYLAA